MFTLFFSPYFPLLRAPFFVLTKVALDEAKVMGLDDALEYITDDEQVEVTPQSIRIRKVSLVKKGRGRGRGADQGAAVGSLRSARCPAHARVCGTWRSVHACWSVLTVCRVVVTTEALWTAVLTTLLLLIAVVSWFAGPLNEEARRPLSPEWFLTLRVLCERVWTCGVVWVRGLVRGLVTGC